MSIFTKYLIVFGMSMVPVIELRGAVPYGVAAGLSLLPVLLTALLGNMVPVPVILLFIRKILDNILKKRCHGLFIHSVPVKSSL